MKALMFYLFPVQFLCHAEFLFWMYSSEWSKTIKLQDSLINDNFRTNGSIIKIWYSSFKCEATSEGSINSSSFSARFIILQFHEFMLLLCMVEYVICWRDLLLYVTILWTQRILFIFLMGFTFIVLFLLFWLTYIIFFVHSFVYCFIQHRWGSLSIPLC